MYAYSIGQFLFDRILWGLFIATKWLFRLIVYAPLWFTGYIIATALLEKDASAFAWIGLTALFAIVLYQLVFFIKGMIIGLMSENNLFWIPLFLISLTYTCIIPVWMMFDNIHAIILEISTTQAGLLTWIASFALGIFIYSRYHFLTNIVPAAAYPVYQLGIDISLSLLKTSSSLHAEKSDRTI